MKKRLALLVVVAFLLGSLAPLALAQDETALVIWADDTRAPILQEVGTAFSEEFGVDVVVQEMGFGDIRDQLKVAGPAGEGPDIIIGAHDWLGELVVNGMLAPLDLGDNNTAVIMHGQGLVKCPEIRAFVLHRQVAVFIAHMGLNEHRNANMIGVLTDHITQTPL